MRFDRRDYLERFGLVVDRPGAAPLLVGEQQRLRDIEIAVSRGIGAVILAVLGLPPGEQVRVGRGVVLAEKMVKPIEQLLRIRIMPRHEDSDQHAITVAFGNAQETGAFVIDINDVAAFAALFLQIAGLPLVVKTSNRCVAIGCRDGRQNAARRIGLMLGKRP